MAIERIPDDNIPNDPYERPLSSLSDAERARPQRLDNELQADPELREGPASTSRVALFAVGIALVLGAVFYGLNNTSVKEAQTPPPAQTAQTQNAAPQGPPAGMRDVTPAPNTEPGTTTGSTTNRPTAPQSAPKGTEVDRAANPPATNNK